MKIQHTLNVERREKTGSRYAKRYRDAGKLPAVLYGHGKPPVALLLNAKRATKFFQLGEKLFNISLESEGAEQAVFLKDVQFDYLGDTIVHVDLARVDLDEQIESNVPLVFVGEAKGAKGAGILTTQMDALPVTCAVKDLPDEIKVDVSNVDDENPLHAGEIALPEGVALDTDPNDIVVSISFAKESGIEGEAEAIGAEDASPEVITEKKKDEDED
ncbi:MAG: 50S ribosomal protein L25 [Phycisphaerales bacterium]